MTQDVLGHAPAQRAEQTLAPLGGHHDQVGGDLVGDLGDLLDRIAVARLLVPNAGLELRQLGRDKMRRIVDEEEYEEQRDGLFRKLERLQLRAGELFG